MRKLTIILVIIIGISTFSFFYLLTANTTGITQQKVSKIVNRFREEKNIGTTQLPVYTVKAEDRALLTRLVNNIWMDLYSVDDAPQDITHKENGRVREESTKKENEINTKKNPGYVISIGAYSTYDNALTASQRFKKYATRVVKSTRSKYYFVILDRAFATKNDAISFQKKLNTEGITNLIKFNIWVS